MPGLTVAKVASLRLNCGNRKHELTLKHIRQIHVCTALRCVLVRAVGKMETVTLSACSLLQRNCMCLLLLLLLLLLVVVVLKEYLMLLSVPMNCGHFHLTYFIQTFIT